MQTTRRIFLLSTAALSGCAAQATLIETPRVEPPIAAGIAGRGAFRRIRERDMYVEVAGSSNAPPLLYLHGGPGDGCYDFSVTQGARLAPTAHLIMIDQRGSLRSQPLQGDDSCTLSDLVEDTEALRASLGVRRWSILGHSFGGYLGLAYALAYPNRIDRLLFENPTFDFDSSARDLMRGAAEEYRQAGDEANAQRALEAAAATTTPRETWETFTRVTNALGAARANLYIHGPEKDFYQRLVAQSGLPRDLWSRAGEYQRRLYAEGAVFESLTARLREVQSPTLLIHGAYDRVTAPDQVAAIAAMPTGRVEVFENSSHFARYEEPERYARVVRDFLAD
jgi:proline iminopeptidase